MEHISLFQSLVSGTVLENVENSTRTLYTCTLNIPFLCTKKPYEHTYEYVVQLCGDYLRVTCVWATYLSHGKTLNKFTTYHMTPKPILYAKFPGSGGVCECREVRWRSISDAFSSTYARRAASASTSRSAGRSAAKAKSTASASAGSPLRVAATTRTSETPSKTRIFLKPRIFRDGRAEWWIGDACSGWLMGLITHKVTHSCILIWSYRK